MKKVRAQLAVIENLRHPWYVVRKIVEVLFLVLCAIFCGLDFLRNILIFAEDNQGSLRKRLEIEKISLKATLACILNMVDGTSVIS